MKVRNTYELRLFAGAFTRLCDCTYFRLCEKDICEFAREGEGRQQTVLRQYRIVCKIYM